LINLVGNALKFTCHGGVTLRLEVHSGDVPEKQLLTIEVEDTGTGIAPDDLECIFQPFVQVGDQTTQKGTGLGLTITRQFVELMGGRITVESMPETGSKFLVAVPVGRAEKIEISVFADNRGRCIGRADDQAEFRVLIVEVETENWLLLQRLLEETGFLVRHAVNGAAAVEEFRAWCPHFIWMGIRLPIMDGLETTRRIRELPGGRDVKIAACTASVFTNERDKCLAAGMDDSIPKPYRMNELFDCMARNLKIRFVYEYLPVGVTTTSPETTLYPETMAVLSPKLRKELADTVLRLDCAGITELVTRVSAVEPALGRVLAHYADRLDYTEILRVLQACENMSDQETL
jgi:CheY-like chemotaxis protein